MCGAAHWMGWCDGVGSRGAWEVWPVFVLVSGADSIVCLACLPAWRLSAAPLFAILRAGWPSDGVVFANLGTHPPRVAACFAMTDGPTRGVVSVVGESVYGVSALRRPHLAPLCAQYIDDQLLAAGFSYACMFARGFCPMGGSVCQPAAAGSGPPGRRGWVGMGAPCPLPHACAHPLCLCASWRASLASAAGPAMAGWSTYWAGGGSGVGSLLITSPLPRPAATLPRCGLSLLTLVFLFLCDARPPAPFSVCMLRTRLLPLSYLILLRYLQRLWATTAPRGRAPPATPSCPRRPSPSLPSSRPSPLTPSLDRASASRASATPLHEARWMTMRAAWYVLISFWWWGWGVVHVVGLHGVGAAAAVVLRALASGGGAC